MSLSWPSFEERGLLLYCLLFSESVSCLVFLPSVFANLHMRLYCAELFSAELHNGFLVIMFYVKAVLCDYGIWFES